MSKRFPCVICGKPINNGYGNNVLKSIVISLTIPNQLSRLEGVAMSVILNM